MRGLIHPCLAAAGLLYLAGHAGAAPPAVLAPDSIVAGKTVTEWTVEWNKWFYSYPVTAPHPFGEGAMLDASVNQPPGVFFLAGTTGANVTRSFTVPAGVPVLVPIFTMEWSKHESPELTLDQLRALCHNVTEDATSLTATFNGVPLVADLFANRMTHRHTMDTPFFFNFVADNVANVPAGFSGEAVSDGYYLMLEPLPFGTHSLIFGASVDTAAFGDPVSFSFSINDTITVVPTPGAAAMLAAGLPLMLLRRRRDAR